MSRCTSDQAASNLPDLPAAWLGQLFKLVASDTSGVASTAALSQTCKGLYAAGDELASSYMQIKEIYISRPDHCFWHWLAKREGRVAGLALTVTPFIDRWPGAQVWEVQEQAGWEEPLRLLSRVCGLSLTVRLPSIARLNRPSTKQWLVEHSYLFEHLIADVRPDTPEWDFTDLLGAAASCRSLNLTGYGSIRSKPGRVPYDIGGFTGMSGLTQLTALKLHNFDMYEDPWVILAALINLRQLGCDLISDVDPSPLTALTKLTCLRISSTGRYHIENGQGEEFAPFCFSSLQPLSALQQLQKLELDGGAYSGTSLKGLAGLPQLREFKQDYGHLLSLEGLGPGITSLSLWSVPFSSLDGVEAATSLQRLVLYDIRPPMLNPLASLSTLTELSITGNDDPANDSQLITLRHLEGSCSSLQHLLLNRCPNLQSLAGVEQLCNLNMLYLIVCNVTSLQPLAQLTGLTTLYIENCKDVVDQCLELPHLKPEAVLTVSGTPVEIVRAGGVTVVGR